MAEDTENSENSSKTVQCWKYRGCHGIMGLTEPMEEECPHARDDCYSPCPAECKYSASCSRPWHEVAHSMDLILNPEVDRHGAIKQQCYMCVHFLTNGPRIGDPELQSTMRPDSATVEADNAVTLHIF